MSDNKKPERWTWDAIADESNRFYWDKMQTINDFIDSCKFFFNANDPYIDWQEKEIERLDGAYNSTMQLRVYAEKQIKEQQTRIAELESNPVVRNTGVGRYSVSFDENRKDMLDEKDARIAELEEELSKLINNKDDSILNKLLKNKVDHTVEKIKEKNKTIAKLREALEASTSWIEVQVESEFFECRGDEDCDHCHGIGIASEFRSALKECFGEEK